jgi:hypothetical protein
MSTSMRVSARDRAEPKTVSRAHAGAAPIMIRRRRQALPGGLMLAIAAVWCAVPIRGLLAGAPDVIPGLGVVGAAGALLIGTVLGVLGLSWIVRCKVVVIDRDLVEVTERRLTGTRVWHEPLTGYRGVRERQEQRPHRYGARIWHVIELWHPEAEKTVELARARDAGAVERAAHSWARRLALPLCRPPDAPRADGARREVKEEVAATTESVRALPAA